MGTGTKNFDPALWQDVLDGMKAGGGSNVYFLKEAKTRLRLLLSDDQELPQFWADTEKHYKGKVSPAHLIYGVILGTSKAGDENVSIEKVDVIRIPKTVLRGILSNLAEGHELFDEQTGHGIIIEKTSGGDRTSYVVKVSPKPVAVGPGLTWPDRSLDELAVEETDRAIKRDLKNATALAEAEADEDMLPF